MSGNTLLALVVIVLAITFIARRADVRLVLALSALPLYAVAERFPDVFGIIADEMANPRTVVPICSAMGFAFVLKLTECDQHLIHLLLRPLRYVRALLVPGGIAAGFIVNTVIVSQTGSAAVLGPVLIPLLRAGGVSTTTAGAVLLIGCSMGGELFNPGAVEMVTLASLTEREPVEVVARTAPLNLTACTAALLAFWALAYWRHDRPLSARVLGTEAADEAASGVGSFRVNPIKAAVPVLPLALLFLAPGFFDTHLSLPEPWEHLAAPARILTAMLIGVVAAGLTSPSKLGRLSAAFFEGAGFAYSHVISLIVVATLFARGIEASGLMETLIAGLTGRPGIATVAGLGTTWSLATITGSGIAPVVAVMTALIPEASEMGLDPVRLGSLMAIGGHFGRTMSPAAAVLMMSAKLAQAEPIELIKRVAPALLFGGLVLMIAVSLGLVA